MDDLLDLKVGWDAVSESSYPMYTSGTAGRLVSEVVGRAEADVGLLVTRLKEHICLEPRMCSAPRNRTDNPTAPRMLCKPVQAGSSLRDPHITARGTRTKSRDRVMLSMFSPANQPLQDYFLVCGLATKCCLMDDAGKSETQVPNEMATSRKPGSWLIQVSYFGSHVIPHHGPPCVERPWD